MADFALVTCSENIAEDTTKKSFFQKLLRKLHIFFKQPKPEASVTKIELYDHVTLRHIKLPYSFDELLSTAAAKARALISEACRESPPVKCILPEKLEFLGTEETIKADVFSGRYLFKALLLAILDEITPKKTRKFENDRRLGDLEMTIIPGADPEELCACIRLLSPSVRYVAIVSKDKEKLEDRMNEIYEDCGLAVGLTEDLKGSLRNARVVINLGGLSALRNDIRMDPNALVMNYGDENDVKRLTGGTVINGIEVGLPEAVTSKLDAEILKLYSKTGLAEMVLMHQLYDGNILSVNFNSLEDVTRISWTFKEEGYRIAAFRGRHNAVKPAEISRRLYSEA